MTDTPRRTGLLIVLDGFGYSPAHRRQRDRRGNSTDVGRAVESRAAYIDLRVPVTTSDCRRGRWATPKWAT